MAHDPTGGDPEPRAERRSYREIVLSSALLGGASALGLLIGLVRTKASAVLLGPSGYGLVGMYTSILELAVGVAGMGVGGSAVRQVSESVGDGDPARIARVVAVVRGLSLVLGALGAVVVLALAGPISTLTFGSDRHAFAVGLLALALLFQLQMTAQTALLQGLRRIADLARVQVVAALLSSIVAVALLYFYREDGVAPSLVVAAFIGAAVSWWFARRAAPPLASIGWADIRGQSASLLGLGAAFMLSGFLMLGTAYAVRAIIVQHDGLAGAGLYQTAWTLGGLYVGFVLQAMGTDFYPRLVAVARDDAQCNRLVNEQALVSMLLAGPGLLATISFAPLLIHLLFSSRFVHADMTLRWLCLGMALRVVVWPLGFVLVAKQRRVLFVGADLLWTLAAVGLSWLLVQRFHVEGAGLAFFGAYVLHAAVVYPVVVRLTGFRPQRRNLLTFALLAALVTIVFVAAVKLQPLTAMLIGSAATLAALWYAVRTLAVLDALPRMLLPLRRVAFLPRLPAQLPSKRGDPPDPGR